MEAELDDRVLLGARRVVCRTQINGQVRHVAVSRAKRSRGCEMAV